MCSELVTITGAGIVNAEFSSTPCWCLCCSLGSGERSSALKSPAERGVFFRQRGCEVSLGGFCAVLVSKVNFPLARLPLRIYSRKLARRSTDPSCPASTEAIIFFLMSGSGDAVAVLFLRGKIRFLSPRQAVPTAPRPCALPGPG